MPIANYYGLVNAGVDCFCIYLGNELDIPPKEDIPKFDIPLDIYMVILFFILLVSIVVIVAPPIYTYLKIVCVFSCIIYFLKLY